jgi:hypothetical protein
MEQKGDISGGIWSMRKTGNLAQIIVAGLFGVSRRNGALIFARAANLFGLQTDGEKRKIIYIFPG